MAQKKVQCQFSKGIPYFKVKSTSTPRSQPTKNLRASRQQFDNCPRPNDQTTTNEENELITTDKAESATDHPPRLRFDMAAYEKKYKIWQKIEDK